MVWVARIDGISRIELDSPSELFDRRSGIVGRVRKAYDHSGTIYAAGDPHLWVKESGSSSFEAIPGLSGQYWDVLEFQGRLLVAGGQVYEIDGNQAHPILDESMRAATRMYASKQVPNTLYRGLTGASPGL